MPVPPLDTASGLCPACSRPRCTCSHRAKKRAEYERRHGCAQPGDRRGDRREPLPHREVADSGPDERSQTAQNVETIDVESTEHGTRGRLPAGITEPSARILALFDVEYRRRSSEGRLWVPFAVDWVSEQTGVPQRTVARTLKRMHAEGVIFWTGLMLRNRTRLWAPGDGTPREWPKPVRAPKPTPQLAPVPIRVRPVTGPELLERALARAEPGRRNGTALWLACQLRDTGLALDIAGLVMAVFVSNCPPGDHPFTEQEAMRALASAWTRPPREPFNVVEC